MSKSVNKIRYRFNVPEDDQLVTTWMDKQHDKSLSIREIIKDYIKEHGIKDVFATEVIYDNFIPTKTSVEKPIEKEVLPQAKEEVKPKEEIISNNESLKNEEALNRLRRMKGASSSNNSQSMEDMMNLLNK